MHTNYHARHIDRFYAELLAGQLPGVVARPALTLDVHELYQAWCARQNVPPTGSPGTLATALQRRHQVPLLRKRYAIGTEILGPHGVLYLAAPPAPRYGFEPDWLGDQITKFRQASADYCAPRTAVRIVTNG